MDSLIKRPSAWVPIVLSLTTLVAMLTTIALSGPPAPQADEGVGAHLFQLWLALEVLLVAFFALTWLPRAPKQALAILAVQILAALLPMSIVFSLNL